MSLISCVTAADAPMHYSARRSVTAPPRADNATNITSVSTPADHRAGTCFNATAAAGAGANLLTTEIFHYQVVSLTDALPRP